MATATRSDTINWGLDFSSFALSLTGERNSLASSSTRPSTSGHGRRRTNSNSSSFSRSTPTRPQTSSNAYKSADDFYDGSDLATTLNLGESIRARRGRDDIAALVDFLKNHPPPPDSFMSTPYDFGNEEDEGRWAAKLRNITKKRTKSVPRLPHIRLPDSAVSGTTIGGHRHIAISIPVEASPFGEMPRSQYPVYPNTDVKSNPSLRSNPIRTYTNEKGTVTVLRPVTELLETSADEPQSLPRHDENSPPKPPPKDIKPTTNGLTNCDANSKADRIDTPVLVEDNAPSNWLPQQRGASRGTEPPVSFERSAYPARHSSMAASRGVNRHHPVSIDGLISQNDDAIHAFTATHNEPSSETRNVVPSFPGVTRTRQSREPKPISKIINERKSELKHPTGSSSLMTIISDNPFGSATEESRPSTRGSTRSRRDLVRDKKRRDLEAARKAISVPHSPNLSSGQDESRDSGAEMNNSEQSPTGSAAENSGKARSGHTGASQNDRSVAQPTLCPIMVVMDVEPSATDDEKNETKVAEQPITPKLAPSPELHSDEALEISRQSRPRTPVRIVSSDGSPLRKARSMDRTSLTRRREWNASREQERQKRESMAAARARIKQLVAAGVPYERTKESETEKEIVKLCEAFREHRFNDIERRLRRLEQNGDVWLQALLPVLEHMNSSITTMQKNTSPSLQGWTSDDEGTEAARGQIGRSVDGLIAPTPARVSQEDSIKVPVLNGTDTKSWTGSMIQRHDVNGLGAIEPLMRELAGESQRESVQRQMVAARALGINDEGAMKALIGQHKRMAERNLI